MSQPPEVLAMILCDLIITDAETHKKSLIGLFDHVETTVLPCEVHELHLYLSLTDGHGALPVTIACVPADGGEELFRDQAEVLFSSPLEVVEMQFVFPRARFPRLGEYRFQLLADGQLLRERKFFVARPPGGDDD